MHLAADAAGSPFIASSSSHLAKIGGKNHGHQKLELNNLANHGYINLYIILLYIYIYVSIMIHPNDRKHTNIYQRPTTCVPTSWKNHLQHATSSTDFTPRQGNRLNEKAARNQR